MSRYTHPLAQGLSTVRYREADGYGVGVAGGNGPLRRVAEDAERLETGEEPGSSLQNFSLYRDDGD
jgi:hypothetical protein